MASRTSSSSSVATTSTTSSTPSSTKPSTKWEIYARKCEAMDDECLHDEWKAYTKEIAVAGTDEAIASLMTPFTLGASLVGVAKSGKHIHDARHKRKIIEDVLHERGLEHHTRMQTVLWQVLKQTGKGTVSVGMNTVVG